MSANDFRRLPVEKEDIAGSSDDVAGVIAGLLGENTGDEICCLLTWGQENVGKWTWVHPIKLAPIELDGQTYSAEFRRI